jgi:SynChlorMet cassette radical SAM/SPASM protein ScmF
MTNSCDVPAPSPEVPKPDLPEGVPPLGCFYLYLTSCCNLRCRHCWVDPVYEGEELREGTYIDLDALRKGVTEAKTLGLCGAKLTGGEPMLHPQFKELVSYLASENISLSMETNGTLITPELAKFLKEEGKFTFISVSLDAPDPAGHDAFRGVKGAFLRTLAGLDALVAAGYTNCQVIMAVHRKNRHQMADVVRLATQHGAASVKFNPVMRNGRGITMYERGETLTFTELLALSEYINNELRPQSKIEVIRSLPPALTSLGELRRTMGQCGDCGVETILGILGTGEIAMCGIGQTIPALVYGKLGKDSIRSIWLNNPIIRDLRRDLSDAKGYPGICGNCIHAKSCRTGCVAENYVQNGSLVSPQFECLAAEQGGIFPKTRMKFFVAK